MTSAAEVLVVDVKAVAKGYRLTTLLGTDVMNDSDEGIGTFEDLIIAKERRRCLRCCGLKRLRTAIQIDCGQR
jgi:hypothetical protein